jgi:hypothetical protein
VRHEETARLFWGEILKLQSDLTRWELSQKLKELFFAYALQFVAFWQLTYSCAKL